MSKRGDPTRILTTKVKKRRGMGSRAIAIPDSDDEDPSAMASEEYALVTKTRVGASGKAERVSMSSIPIFERPITPTPLEENTVNDSMDVAFDQVIAMPAISAIRARKPKKVNDSVSEPNDTDLFESLTTL